MSEKYKVYPVVTINVPKLHPGITMLNYEANYTKGQILDVRTCRYITGQVEIKLAQIVDTDGNHICDVPFDRIILSDNVHSNPSDDEY